MIWNLLLMLAWAAFWNSFTPTSLLSGFVVGYLTLWLFARRGVNGPSRYIHRFGQTVGLVTFFFYELVVSNLRMAREVLTPRLTMRPAIIRIPLEESPDTDVEIAILSNMITLTPGTLLLDISPDRKSLFVHVMDVPGGNPDLVRAQIKHDLERRVLEVLK